MLVALVGKVVMRSEATVPSGSVPWNKLELSTTLVVPPGLAWATDVADSLSGNSSMPKSLPAMLVVTTSKATWFKGLVLTQPLGKPAAGKPEATVVALLESQTLTPVWFGVTLPNK